MARKAKTPELDDDFTCEVCGSHLRMYNQNTKEFECGTCYAKKQMTTSIVDKVMAVLIEKYDKGEARSQYKFNDRVFTIVLEEKNRPAQVQSTPA